MTTLSGIDAAFLYAESESVPLHVSGVIELRPPAGWGVADLRALLAERLVLLPPFRQRLNPASMLLRSPVWEDAEPDLAVHVDVRACPGRGGPDDLAGVVAELAAQRLPRDRPLWRATLVEGLADGGAAVVLAVHHCAVDGVAAGEILIRLLDLEPAPGPRPPEAVASAGSPGLGRVLAGTAWGWARRPVNLLTVLPEVAGSVAGLVRSRVTQMPGSHSATPFLAPRTGFNAPLSPPRAVALATLPLAELKEVRRTLGATVHEVVMAVVGGALRHYLLLRGELPERSLTAMSPVSVHDSEASSRSANQVSAMFTTLATDLADPAERLKVVRTSSQAAKLEHSALGDALVERVAEVAEPVVFSLLSRAYATSVVADRVPPVYNVVVSNVPGPPMPLWLAGAPVTSLHPLGPVFHGNGLNITVISYNGQVEFGLLACAELVPDVGLLRDQLQVALADLRDAVGVGPAG